MAGDIPHFCVILVLCDPAPRITSKPCTVLFMSHDPESQTRSNNTPPSDRTLPLGWVRELIEADLGKRIPRSTWSEWNRRVLGHGDATQDREIPIEVAASLVTIGGLHKYQARSYHGDAYKELYPLCLKRIKEICNV